MKQIGRTTPAREAWYSCHSLAVVNGTRSVFPLCRFLGRDTDGAVHVAHKVVKWGRNCESFTTEWKEEIVPARERPVVRFMEDTRRGVGV